MLWYKTAFTALLFSSYSSALPQLHVGTNYNTPLEPRDTVNATSYDSSNTLLEPVIPNNVNPADLGILSLNQSVVLAWAGSAAGSKFRRKMRRDGSDVTSRPLLKRDGAFTSQANFTFQYPTIPLDHSNYVSSVSCKNGSLTATLSSAAYGYAKSSWTKAAKIVFVTSVDGCGADDQNYLFLASNITFSDSGSTFTARGTVSTYKGVGRHMNLQWGNVPPTSVVRRAADKSEVSICPSLSLHTLSIASRHPFNLRYRVLCCFS